MGLPGWALLALVGFPLAQIPLVWYLSRWFELDEETPAPTPGRAYWTEGPQSAPSATASPPGLCQRCGAENDPVFTFCRGCTARF